MKNNKGITMIVLVITIIILLMLAGISINVGRNVIKRSELENSKTNMLLIKVKAKEYVENANFKLGTNIENATDKDTRVSSALEELKGENITNGDIFSDNIKITTNEITESNSNYIYYYKLLTQNLTDMGLSNVQSNENLGWYVIKYDIKNANVEVYNTRGFENDETTYYSLNEIQDLEI